MCRYYNGDYYEGTWAEGVRSGAGMQQCMDGSNYVGEYRDAKREGHGVYTFHNGDCYLGTYQADLPNGIGVYLFEKGQKYMGEWAHGKKHGMCAPLRRLLLALPRTHAYALVQTGPCGAQVRVHRGERRAVRGRVGGRQAQVGAEPRRRRGGAQQALRGHASQGRHRPRGARFPRLFAERCGFGA